MFRTYSSATYKISSNLFGFDSLGVKKNLLHLTPLNKLPRTAILQLPSNVIDINASETSQFSPLRSRDILGSVMNLNNENIHHRGADIDITTQMDEHVNKYDSFGAVSLSSSMQSNVPSPFSGNNTHLNMPGSQWGQGFKYLSGHLHGAHYLTLRNEYRKRNNKTVTIGSRIMSTDSNQLTAKQKLKRAVKEYGSTVIVFHVSISLISLASCYVLVTSGVDVIGILQRFNLGEGTLVKLASSNTGTFVIAYAVHKIFAPARIAVTLTLTPFIVRYLRKIGFLKHDVMSVKK